MRSSSRCAFETSRHRFARLRGDRRRPTVTVLRSTLPRALRDASRRPAGPGEDAPHRQLQPTYRHVHLNEPLEARGVGTACAALATFVGAQGPRRTARVVSRLTALHELRTLFPRHADPAMTGAPDPGGPSIERPSGDALGARRCLPRSGREVGPLTPRSPRRASPPAAARRRPPAPRQRRELPTPRGAFHRRVPARPPICVGAPAFTEP